ncbi:UNVERIFIED_CONTAM: Pectinesterase QRT1 [Sesamum calycinum]|uniref:Pectinesterase n=1 Tax=Sesamum calycinum TaxID=2727403 RepID=A0AAW2Q575_9LAMI
MNLTGLMTCFLVLLLFWGEVKIGFGQINGDGRNYITWNDLNVDDHRSPLRESGYQKRVIVVDVNGRGDSVTVQGAVDMVPENNTERVKIHVLPGVYSDDLIAFLEMQREGTWKSASVTVESDYFCASGITFENTVVAAGGGVDGYQAVALRISGEKAVFYKVRFLGSQDTLLDESGSHYFFHCFIQGSVDFIFGNARSLYQECEISVVGDGFAVAAQHRNSVAEDTGFSFVNCTVSGTGNVYLGRAWGNYSRIIYSYCEFDIDVRPEGWEDWRVPSRQNTVVFGEYECRGRGADRSRRATWSRALNCSEARPFFDTAFIRGEQWLRL